MNLSEILRMFRQDKTSIKSHIKNLCEVALADKSFTGAEEQLLYGIAERVGISRKEIEKIKANPQDISFEIPTDHFEKFQQMYDLVHMMIVDKAVDREEWKLCEVFARKFGYRDEVVEEMVDTIKSNIEHKNDAEETYKRISYLKL
jgi:uncharacterized tellurite resistance protein B-like protein